MSRADWNLLVLSAAEGQYLTPVQLQKCLFLLGKVLSKMGGAAGFYRFKNYNYGAFDPNVYVDAERMEPAGLTEIGQSRTGWKKFAATESGLKAAAELRKQIPENVAAYIPELVKWAKGLSFEQLVSAVYTAYPETKSRSIFRG